MTLRGHWFCWHCDEVIFIPLPESLPISPEDCPQCHNCTLNFVPLNPTRLQQIQGGISPARAAELFKKIYQANQT